jgi:hypothetical protein
LFTFSNGYFRHYLRFMDHRIQICWLASIKKGAYYFHVYLSWAVVEDEASVKLCHMCE